MGWRHDHLYGVETYEAMRLRVLENLDLPECGPPAFLDPERAERTSDYEPSPRWESRPCRGAGDDNSRPSVPVPLPGRDGPATGNATHHRAVGPRLSSSRDRLSHRGDEEGRAA